MYKAIYTKSKTFLETTVMIIVLVLLPLLGNKEVYASWQVWTVVFSVYLLNLSNPAHSIKESRMKTESDGISMLVLLVLAILAFLLPLLDYTYGSVVKIPAHYSFLGLLIMILGLTIRYYAVMTLGKFFDVKVRIQKNHQLIKTGLYKYIRHPSYTGILLTSFGCCLVLRSVLGLLFSLTIYFSAFIYRIHLEEKVLVRHFKEEYTKYSQQTKKLIPFLF